MDRIKLASLLEDIALYMELLGENPFKVRAHQNGARIVEATENLSEHLEKDTLSDIKGIGPGLQEKIKEFAKSGTLAEHTFLKEKISPGLLELLTIPGLGPKKAREVHDKLGIKSAGELEYACRENRLAKLAGFGEKTQAKILKNLEFLKKSQNTFLYSDASLEAKLLLNYLKQSKIIENVEVVGALRRKLETVKGIGLLASLTSFNLVNDFASFVQIYPDIKTFEVRPAQGEISEFTFVLSNGMPVKIKCVTSEIYFSELLKLTGNKEHLKALENLAGSGVEFEKLLQSENFSSEEQIYKKLGLEFIPPELREGRNEIEDLAILNSPRFPKLIEQRELKGIFHCHTTESDGSNSLEEMVSAAQNLGYEYIGISDHSVSSLAYANGLKVERVLDQFCRIEQLQSKFKIKILKGIESDILVDGSLDYNFEMLKKFDFVIGSVHSAFSQKREQMTARVLKALSNPFLDFLGHPTGRLLLARDGFDIDMNAVIDCASANGAVIEINASPQRLDLDWRYGSYIKSQKGLVSINPDAHSIAGLEDVEFGVGIARKAGLAAEHVINTLPATKILGRLRRSRADN